MIIKIGNRQEVLIRSYICAPLLPTFYICLFLYYLDFNNKVIWFMFYNKYIYDTDVIFTLLEHCFSTSWSFISTFHLACWALQHSLKDISGCHKFFLFCVFEMSLFCLHIWSVLALGTTFFLAFDFFLSVVYISHPTASWSVRFLMRQLKSGDLEFLVCFLCLPCNFETYPSVLTGECDGTCLR